MGDEKRENATTHAAMTCNSGWNEMKRPAFVSRPGKADVSVWSKVANHFDMGWCALACVITAWRSPSQLDTNYKSPPWVMKNATTQQPMPQSFATVAETK